jgi:hypothetical protein
VVVVVVVVVVVEEASLTSHLKTSPTTMIWMTLVMLVLQLHQSPRRLHQSSRQQHDPRKRRILQILLQALAMAPRLEPLEQDQLRSELIL